MWTILLYLVIGTVLLYFGSEWMVDGAKKMALRLGVAPFVIGLTVLAFGSSAPEAITSVLSRDTPSMIIGNIVGSNIADIGLAIGLAAILTPVACAFKDMKMEFFATIVSTMMVTAMALFGFIGLIDGIILVCSLFVFVGILYYMQKDNPPEENDIDESDRNTPLWKSSILTIVGLVVLYFGSELFVKGAQELAIAIGVSNLLVGLFVVAIGTSIPELCICLISASRGENDFIVSNIIGSIIFNCFFALGVGALFVDIPISDSVMMFHIPAMLILTFMLLGMIKWKGLINRQMGALLFAVYVCYILVMVAVPSLTA